MRRTPWPLSRYALLLLLLGLVLLLHLLEVGLCDVHCVVHAGPDLDLGTQCRGGTS